MYEEENDTRLSCNVEYSTQNYVLTLEKKELEDQVLKLKDKLKKIVDLCEKE